MRRLPEPRHPVDKRTDVRPDLVEPDTGSFRDLSVGEAVLHDQREQTRLMRRQGRVGAIQVLTQLPNGSFDQLRVHQLLPGPDLSDRVEDVVAAGELDHVSSGSGEDR
jgi:hypothetical protein